MIIIYDESRAIREKAEVDAHNKRLRRPVKIFACITAGIVLLAIVIAILSQANLIHSAYFGLSWVIAILISVALFMFWHIRIEEGLPYSANVQYYLATSGKTVNRVSITPETRFSMKRLVVYVEDRNHKEKAFHIELANMGIKRGTSEDIIDLVEPLGSSHRECWRYGYWYEPYDRKAKELESRVIEADKDET